MENAYIKGFYGFLLSESKGFLIDKKWCQEGDLNPRPPAYEYVKTNYTIG